MFDKLRDASGRTPTDNTVTSVAVDTLEVNEKHPASTDYTSAGDSNGAPQSELPSEELQRGVQNVEAVTLTWSKKTLIAVFLKYVLILRAGIPQVHLADNIPIQYIDRKSTRLNSSHWE